MDGTKCFCYTFSKETTEKILNGDAYLGAGGAKASNGQMIELGRPMILDGSAFTGISQNDNNVESMKELQKINSSLDLSIGKIDELQKTAWLNYAVSRQLCGITMEGFRQTLMKLNIITEEVRSVKLFIETKSTNEHLVRLTSYKNHLNSDADFMTGKRFDVMNSYSMIVPHLDEISAYIRNVEREFIEGSIDGGLACFINSGLLPLFSYVVKRYSAFYYYENERFPANFNVWVGAIESIIKKRQFENRLLYHIRLNSPLSLEDKHIACKKVMGNIEGLVDAMYFEKEYVLCHEKEEYLSLGQHVQKKIENDDHKVIDGHLLVSI